MADPYNRNSYVGSCCSRCERRLTLPILPTFSSGRYTLLLEGISGYRVELIEILVQMWDDHYLPLIRLP